MPELSERAYLSSRVNAGSAFFHAALTWKTPTFLPGSWKRPFVTCFVSFSDLVFNDVSRFQGLSHLFYCNQELFLRKSKCQEISASATTLGRAGSLTHISGLTFLGEFDFTVLFLIYLAFT